MNGNPFDSGINARGCPWKAFLSGDLMGGVSCGVPLCGHGADSIRPFSTVPIGGGF